MLSWAGWGFSLFKLSPIEATGKIVVWHVVIFLSTLQLAILFTSTLFLYLIRRAFGRVESPRVVLRICLREGFLTGLAVVGLGILQLLNVLNLVNAVLLVATLTVIEIYFILRHRETSQ